MKTSIDVGGLINQFSGVEKWLEERLRNERIAFVKNSEDVPQAQILSLADLLIIIGVFKKELRVSREAEFIYKGARFTSKTFFPLATSIVERYSGMDQDFFEFCRSLKVVKSLLQEYADDHVNTAHAHKWINLLIGDLFDCLELAIFKLASETAHSKQSSGFENNELFVVYDHLPLPVVVLNSHGKVLYNNKLAEPLFPCNMQACCTNTPLSILEILKLRTLEFMLSSDESMRFEAVETIDAKSLSYEIFFQRIIHSQEKEHLVVALLSDNAAHSHRIKQLEEAKSKAEQMDQVKTSFLANMSHEIRTPMNAIIGFTDLMLNRNFTPGEAHRYLNLIRNSSGDLLHIIEDIIDVAKLESNKLKVKYKVCSPFKILTDIRDVIAQTLRKYGTSNEIDLILNVPADMHDIQIYTDGERLKQVMTNLLSNAAKFTEKGYIEFGYGLVDDSHIIFTVNDTGIGMAKGVKDRVFDRFYQIENQLSRNTGGAGLGLAITKSIVELLKGRITVESTAGRGSCFTVQLPLHTLPVGALDKEKKSPQEECNIPDLKGLTILIAEDDRTNYIYLRELLKLSGATTIWAHNGIEAIERVETNNAIDLVLMDIKMPEVDGYQASRFIASLRPGLPVIAQTAYAMDGDEAKCRQAGCVAYLRKPVQKQLLFETLVSCVAQKAGSNQKMVSADKE